MKYLIIFFLFAFGKTDAQFLSDEASKITVSRALEKMYNEEWVEAKLILQNVYSKYNNHPVSFLLKATELQLRYTPVESYPVHFEEYMSYLKQCNELAKEGLDNGKWKEEFTFYMLASSGYIAEAYHYKKEYLKAATEGRRAYLYMKDGFEMAAANPEFHFTNGLYKYYREQYPITHPTIKPFMVFFAKGNKEQGIADLREARTNAVFTKNEASMFLVGAFLKYENKAGKALEIASELHKKYAQNQIFFMRYIEALIATNKIEIASTELRKYQHYSKSGLGQISYYLFLAQLEEDVNLSKAYFAKALQVNAQGRFVDDYKSMAYTGLADLFFKEGDFVKAGQFIDKADELAEYTRVKKELEELKLKLNE